jgi:L-lactate dehydrogenase (cytochrome)
MVERSRSAVPRALRRYLSLDDFETTARRRLPKFLYGYIAGAAETDAALADNRRAFDEYGFVPRVLNDVSGRAQITKLFGKTYAAPFGIPPMGSAALCAYRGDPVLTRAAAAMNVPMILSASSLITLEDIRRENPAAWYQAYLAGDASRIEPLVDRVAAAGYDTFVVTGMYRSRPTARTISATAFRSRSRSPPALPGTLSPIRIGCSAPGRAR